MKKRVLAILSAILLCLLVIPVLATEVPTMTVAVTPGAVPGGTVTVTVSISPVEKCTSLGLRLEYDKDVFEVVDGSFAMLIGNTSQASFMYRPQMDTYAAQIRMTSAQDLSGNLFTFQMKVKEDVAAGTSTTISGIPSLRLDMATVNCGVEAATLTIACQHQFGTWTKLDDNNHQRTCSLCGQVEKNPHAWGEGVVTDATCTAEGIITYTCADCGAVKTESIPMKDHTWDSGKVTEEPTCDSQGEKTYTCTACGKTYTEVIGMLEHVYDDGVVTKEPTCTEDGVKTFTCTDCPDFYTQVLPALGHVPGEAVEENRVAPGCTTEGGYDTAVYCSRCGAELSREHHTLDATGHDYNEGAVTTQPTCTEEGVKTFTCRTCWETYTEAVAAKGHTPGEPWGDEWVDPGCETEGSYDLVVTCTTCWEELSREPRTIEATGHKYNDGVVTKEPTCTEEGVKTFTCENCGDYYEESMDLVAHTYDNRCDTDCNVCGATRTTEHNYGERLTYDETGHWHACEECGDVLELESHNPGPEATETEDQICLECGYVIHPAGYHEHKPVGDWLSDENDHWYQCACTEKLEVAPHTWSEGTVDEEAGEIRYFCTACGHNKTELWTKPTEPSQPEQTQPNDGTQPEQTEPAETQPGTTQPGGNDGEDGFPWFIVLVAVVGVAILGAVGYVVVGILMSRKKVGRFSK